jgi:DNA (cytosine-5)-methyltransferase 1
MEWDEPSNTIRTAAYNPSKGKYIHPEENRGLNSYEMKVLQGFDPDWELKLADREGMTLKSAGNQIGNAVPPPLAEAIGRALAIQLKTLKA